MGPEEGFKNMGALSLTSVTVINMEMILVSLRGEVLLASATLNAYSEGSHLEDLLPYKITLILME